LHSSENQHHGRCLLALEASRGDRAGFVTYRNGVWKYDGTTITHYPVQYNAQDIELFSIYQDKQGVLWLGTPENGAFRFNGTTFEPF
jgi:ligand-binding sensor domain-containing protein